MKPILCLICLLIVLSGPARSQELGYEPISPIVPALPGGGGSSAETTPGSAGQAAPGTSAPSAADNVPPRTDGQLCGIISNESGHKIFGTISTDIAGERDGIAARHRATLKLEDDEKRDICSDGPFYDGQRLELTLRSLFPLFSCKTQIAGRVITIRSEPREEGGLKFYAECY